MERISKMWRSALAMVLAICMVLSFCPVAAFAAEPAKKYVSLGDSMTNGYGLTGYDDPHRVNGFLDEVLGAYPYQLENELNFDLVAQLATSAMRAADLNYILRYPNAKADPYTEDEFINNRWTDYAGKDNSKSGVDNVAKIFQKNIKEADVISFCVGNADFGVFMLGRLTNALNVMVEEGKYDDIQAEEAWVNFENALSRLNASQKKAVMAAYNSGLSVLKQKMPAGAPTDLIERLADILGFTMANYLDNAESALDYISQVNPDAEIIMVGIMNTFSGINLDFNYGGKDYSIPMSIILEPFIKSANTYMYALPAAKHAVGEWSGNVFYFAEAQNVQMLVDTYKTDIKGNNSIRTRFIEEVCDTIFPMVGGMFNSLVAEYGLALDSNLTRADVEAYEEFAAAWAADPATASTTLSNNKILSAAIYLAFEEAVLEASDMKSLDATAFMALATEGGLDGIFGGVGGALTADLDMAAIGAGVAGDVTNAIMADAVAVEDIKSHILKTYGDEITDKVMTWVNTNKSDDLASELSTWAKNNRNTEIQDEYIPWVQATYASEIYAEVSGGLTPEEAVAKVANDKMTTDEAKAKLADIINGIFQDNTDTEAQNFAKQTYMDLAADYIADVLIPEYLAKTDVQNYILDKHAPTYIPVYASRYVAAAVTEPLAKALVSNAAIKSLLNLFARMLIGNGIGCHPSAAGHDTLTAAIVEAYETKHTAEEEVKENVNIVLGELKNFLEKYGPEAADQAYKLWVDKGYQALVDQYITELTTNVTDRYTNYTEVVLPAINSALDALNAQKITLTTELATLKTQLLAKKAELEKVLAEQEITDITPPEFDIDTELGNNEQTQVPENDCAGVGSVADELAAAIADLEHAIAVIEALIADVTADIEDLVALATEIAEGVATLEQTLTDVAAAAQDLKNAVDAVVTVLTDDSAKAASKTFMKAFNAARDAALVAVDTVELLVKTANEDVATIEASVATLKEGMNALVNKLCTDWENADKEALLQKIINKLPTSAQVIVGGSVLLVQQTLEENQAAIINKLNAEKDALKVKLDADKEVVLKELAEKKAALEAEYGPQIAAAQAKIDALNAQIDTEIQTKYAELQVAAQAKIDALTLEAQAKIAALDAELQGYVAQLAGDITDEVRETIQAQIDRINNDIAAVNADLACAIEHVDAELKAAYDALVEEVTNAYNDVMTELQNAYNALVDAFETAIKELQDAADNAIQGLIDAYEAAIKALQDAADKAIQELIDAAKKELEKLGEIGEILSELMDSVLAAIHGDVAKAQAAINEILHGALDSVNDLADALVDVGIDTVNTIVDEVTKVINDMLHEATHADLELGAESLYIALGDGTAAPESYVEKLAAQLEAEYGVEDYTNYAQAGNTAGAEVAKVADRAGIADADLITIGFGNATIVETAIRNADSVEYDWAGLVGADLVPYVEDALAEVYAEIANADMSEDMAEFVNSIVEGLAYGAVEYAVELPALIAAIREVNADAVIVIVGQYNPLEDVVLEMGGSTLDLSEYIGYFVDAVAVHGIGYAMITGDAIFVEAPEVDTNNTDTSWSEIDLLKMLMNQKGFEVLNPSESGDTYITNQILGALNITKIEEEPTGLWGDANDNGKVNLQDAIMILKAANGHDIAINRKLSDVTGEGQVKLNDAILVLQRANGSTALFPVEK